MNTWRADWLLRLLLGFTSLTFLVAWLPFVRCPMDGDSYTWSIGWWMFSVGGTGLSAHYWLLVVQVALGVAVLGLGSRGARLPFHWLLLAWHAALFTSFTYSSWTSPDAFVFRGDTAGIEFSLAWVGPVFTGAILAASIFWVVRDLRTPHVREVAPWCRTNTIWLGSLIALFPVQFGLLRFGDPGGTTDLIGVVIVTGQWMPSGPAPHGGWSR